MSSTIVASMAQHAASRPDDVAFRFLTELDAAPQSLSYRQLWQEAGAVATFLRGIAAPGSRIMLFFPPGLAYIKAFYGCLLAGMVAVPLYPPRRNVKSDRIVKVAHSCQGVIALTTDAELATVAAAWDQQNNLGLPLAIHTTDALLWREGADFLPDPVAEDGPAFLQYTSGSTGDPKGVIITHANIIANMKHLSLSSAQNDGQVFVNWIPLFHDLGLVTAILWPVYLGAPSVLMAPATFVRSPILWLKAISDYRGTMCGAPNFAYDLCVEKIAPRDMAGLDLSSWRVAYNSAEPVKADTLEKFSAHCAPFGFRPQAFYPAYGMAEATVFIAGGDTAALPVVLSVDRHALADGRLVPAGADDPAASRIVACGWAAAPHALRIVDPASGFEADEGRVGEIWFSGPSVAPGYWQLDAVSAHTFGRRIAGDDSGRQYLATGDLGVIWQQQLYVTGRIKDLIILRGRNYYPQDLEACAAQAHPAVRPGCCAAFALQLDGVERLVLVAEIERELFRSVDADAVIGAIRQRLVLEYEVNPDEVVLLKPYKIPLTSSGKIQRRQTRQMLADGKLDVLGRSGLAAAGFVAPASAVEQALCDIWRAVLKRERVGAADHFFDLGGDSLAAIEVSVQVKQRLGIELDVAQLLDAPTVAALAQFIELKLAHASRAMAAPSTQSHTTVTL